jgi:hypothetical protein
MKRQFVLSAVTNDKDEKATFKILLFVGIYIFHRGMYPYFNEHCYLLHLRIHNIYVACDQATKYLLT